MREATEHLHHARSNVRIEILQELFLLVDQIVCDARAEPLALPRGAQRRGATVFGIRALLDVSLPNQGADDAAGGALVQEQPLRQRTEAQRTVLDDRLERVALRHRDVVAADAVAVPKLIDADEIGDRLVQGERRRGRAPSAWSPSLAVVRDIVVTDNHIGCWSACQAPRRSSAACRSTSKRWLNTAIVKGL